MITNSAVTVIKPILEVKNLTVSLVGGSAKQVVKNVNFSVNAGETVCVVGESGSGKSVTSFAIMGLLSSNALSPTAGEILLHNENVLKASPKRLRDLRATKMAMIFQEPMTALNPVETVGQQVDEVLCIHRRKLTKQGRHERVIEMFKQVHLPDPERIYSSYPHQLSGGQRQRVVISIALILEPELLICDEPTTALDVTTQKQILLLIRELQEKHNTAVLFITHDFGVVADIADRVVVMNHGDIVEVGSREQILANPKQDYTRMLVSSVPSLLPERREINQNEVILTVKDLSKTYGAKKFLRKDLRVHAASDINLTLRRGEILGVVGESGSGKSTVARCIVRLQDPTSGQIVVCGDNIASIKGAELHQMRKRIQIVFQDPYRSLNPRMTVGDSITEGLINFGVSQKKARQRAQELMILVGLSVEALGRFPHQFSGGQRQRICIARALALEPEVLVADEAVSALDVSVQAQVLTLLNDIRLKTGVGVLFITHDLRVAAQICDTIMVMQNGNMVEFGPAIDVLTSPQQSYTQSLLNAAPGRHWDFRNFCPIQ